MQRLRQRARRHALDCFLVLLAAGEVVSVLMGDAPHRPVAALITAVSVLVLLAHRWQPLAASIAAFAALALLAEVSPTTTLAQFFGLLATFAAVGAVNRPRDAVVAWLFGAAVVGYSEGTDPNAGGIADVLLTLAVVTTLWVAGLLVAHRARSADAAVRRAEHAEQDRQQHAVRAVTEERARIARELHDIVSHGLSVVVLQTLAARAALADGEPGSQEDADRHLDAVESTAREALGEMRRMLGLLQVDDLEQAAVPAPDAPSPGLRALPQLIDRAAAAGLRISAVDVDPDASLPVGLELAVHRIVQEALTNAVKHAPGSAVTVAVRIHEASVVVTVANGPGTAAHEAPHGAGHGLIGMRQRVELYGGSLAAGPRLDGGFAVTAVLPRDDQDLPGARTDPSQWATA